MRSVTAACGALLDALPSSPPASLGALGRVPLRHLGWKRKEQQSVPPHDQESPGDDDRAPAAHRLLPAGGTIHAQMRPTPRIASAAPPPKRVLRHRAPQLGGVFTSAHCVAHLAGRPPNNHNISHASEKLRNLMQGMVEPGQACGAFEQCHHGFPHRLVSGRGHPSHPRVPVISFAGVGGGPLKI